MLYRLHPPAGVDWFALAGLRIDDLREQHIELDQLEWQPTEDRQFSTDLLRIALRHGIASRLGLVVDAEHTTDLGRADELRVNQQAIDELQATLRTQNGPLMDQLMPGWAEEGAKLDDRVRESTESVAREAEDDLGEVLAAPIDPILAEHWRSLGGTVPN